MQVLRARQFLVKRNGEDALTNAAVLLFGRNVLGFYPHCRIRYIKVDGREMLTGANFNVVKDKSIDEPLLRLIPRAKQFIADQLEERTRFESDGRFHTYPEYPEFAWVESITNAVVHRQWGLRGDHILVSKYTDRLEIKSPGRLPDMVTVENICTTRFSRNPLISRVLTEMGLVRELNEGVKRVFQVMQDAGLPKPVIRENPMGVTIILYNDLHNTEETTQKTEETTQKTTQKTEESREKSREKSVEKSEDNVKMSPKMSPKMSLKMSLKMSPKPKQQQRLETLIASIIDNPQITATQLAQQLSIADKTIKRDLALLSEAGIIRRVGPSNGGHWEVLVEK